MKVELEVNLDNYIEMRIKATELVVFGIEECVTIAESHRWASLNIKHHTVKISSVINRIVCGGQEDNNKNNKALMEKEKVGDLSRS